MSVGLGIKIPSLETVDNNRDASHHQRGVLPSDSQNRSKKVASDWSELSGTTRGLPTLRSASSMRGLLLAEVGDAMVELDVCGEGSGFRQGQRIAFDHDRSPEGGSNLPQMTEEVALSRHGTLLSVGANPGRNAAELKSILGNSSARLKSGAALLPASGQSFHGEERTVFEQAKSRARVEVDIILVSKTCIQGGYLQGQIKIKIRSPSNKESPVMISDGKVRVIGFECISNEHDRYPFYQCSAPLSTITATPGSLCGYPYDAEGFAPAVEGEHILAFSMHLPMSTEHDVPKGVLHTQIGVAVRYIAMVSMKVKDSDTGKRSIAHFYRNCEVWPRLNPAVILAPAMKPLRMMTSKRLFMGGTGKVTLTAFLHRLHWIAGQQCCVKVDVKNTTKKAINSLTLTLVRSTVVFKPDARLDALNDNHNMDPDACQTSTTQKVVAESVLELGQRGARGHASAKGWWTGVRPGEHMEFFHFIQLPSDTLSITRSRLLEVDYSLRVTLSAGTLRTTDVQVTLPVRIVNFLSVDPPPSFPLGNDAVNYVNPDKCDVASVLAPGRLQRNSHPHSRPVVVGLFGSYGPTTRPLESLAEANDDSPVFPTRDLQDDALQDELPENSSDDLDLDGEYTEENSRYDYLDALEPNDELGNLSMYEDDTDEVVQHALSLTKVDEFENAPRFADLYYASVQEDLHQLTHRISTREIPKEQAYRGEGSRSKPSSRQQSPNLRTRNPEGYPDLRPNARPPISLSRPNRPRGPSLFAQRVQEKREAHGIESESVNHTSSDECDEGPQGARDGHIKTSMNSNCIHGSLNASPPSSRSNPDNQELQRGGPNRSVTGPEALKLTRTADGYSSASQEHSMPSSTASSAFASVSNRSGSRLLPRPPSVPNCLPPAPELVTSLSNQIVPAHKYKPDHAQPLEQSCSGSSEDDAQASSSTGTRPKLRPRLESASSVKDKIRELEERVKAAEQL